MSTCQNEKLQLWMYTKDWEIYQIIVYCSSGILVVLQIWCLIKTCIQKGTGIPCLILNLTAQILVNILAVLTVSVLKDNPKWTSLAISAQQVFLGIVLSTIATRYIAVYKGNTFIMNNKEIPPELIKQNINVFFSYFALNSILPITICYFLFKNGMSPYVVASCNREFFLLMALMIGNCLIHIIMAVIFIVFILLTVKQLKDHGFSTKVHNNSVLYQAITFLFYFCT